MTWTTRVGMVSVLSLAAACGNGETTETPDLGTVALFAVDCERTEDCKEGGVCVTVLGQAACAPGCDGIGAASTCPVGSVGACEADGFGNFGCVPTCAECPDDWSCVELGDGSVCAPPGADVNACSSGFQRCGGVCTKLFDNPEHCGKCDNACAEGGSCDGNDCVCPAATPTDCGGVCVSTNTDEAHCGFCDTPCALANAAASCLSGECNLVSCEDGFLNCDGEDETGCETDEDDVPIPVITIAEGDKVDELTTLTLSANDSTAPSPITGWDWKVSTPPGSLGAFAPDATVESPTFEVADLVGNFTFSLGISDESGAQSCGSAQQVVTVIPTGLVHLELAWPDGGDLDLHFRHSEATQWFDPELDAWAGNPNPDWDDVNDDGDDPNLKQHMSASPGVEVLSMGLPNTDATFRVGVHYNGDGPGVTAQLRIFVNDKLEYSRTDVVLSGGDLWDVGVLPWGEAFQPELGPDGEAVIEAGVTAP